MSAKTVYGKTAVEAAKQSQGGAIPDLTAAWKSAVLKFTNSKSSQDKGCPKAAFVGLCRCGYVKGIEAQTSLPETLNGQYAVNAAKLLLSSDVCAASELWQRVTNGKKAENGQMKVVLALFDANMIVSP